MDPINWLIDADPAIRWQAMRDLTDATPASLAAERARIPHQGLGAGILRCQQADGSWRLPNRPAWLPTLFTLLMLRTTGIDRTEPTVESAITRLESTLHFHDGDRGWDLHPVKPGDTSFFEGEEEPCINGGVLALGAYFGRPSESLASRLIAEQLEDGGWNCEAPNSTRSSFHTTLCVLEGLLEYERAVGVSPQIAAARKRGEAYLLERELFKRRSTGEVANPAFLELAFPPRYHYDILRALDHFRNAGPPDARMGAAVDLIKSKRQAGGRWLLDHCYDEALPIKTGETVGEPSRWNTLRAQRVLHWYEGTRPTSKPNAAT